MEILDSPSLFIPLINTRIIKTEWQDVTLALQDFSQSNKQKLRFQLALNKTFWTTLAPLIHQQWKHPQQNKN